MTTKVTVDAHAGWPVKVDRVEIKTGLKTELETCPPLEKRDYSVWDGMALFISELPMPVKEK